MKIAGVVAVMVLLAGPVWAQDAVPKYGDPDKDKTPADIAGEKAGREGLPAVAEQYTAQKSHDPWGIARESAPASAAKASPAKPKASKAETKSADTKPGNNAK